MSERLPPLCLARLGDPAQDEREPWIPSPEDIVQTSAAFESIFNKSWAELVVEAEATEL